ncbi:hypothetical protein PHYSODRAFT_307244 [Phytophthora sojae]|uniref:Uncharacterized protein n=1 Tax=Phytophthora sojae (strain P6497) TaxID=1094619 RepID=G5ADH4_PHYSP|nr:hypothetical protein PHYSODRAFT_307244 [Phytophthora sojae]EGZ06227.1 hypothetical protein PHYSODRAFT_307244 [Phytophthora sojae]|eukprot:XP_009538124.1 hypothetical protein PHYSODRAFT_307244 [Phytophthora sojae]
MFPGMTNGTYASPCSLLHTVSTDEAIQFDKSEAILMALASGQIGRDGVCILHFEQSSASNYAAKVKQRRLLADFSGHAMLPVIKRLEPGQQPLTYAHRLLAIEGLGVFTRRYCFDFINEMVNRLRDFVAKNAQHDERATLPRVMLTLHTVDMFLSRALNHLRSDSPSWWANFRAEVQRMDYNSTEWVLLLSSLLTSTPAHQTTAASTTNHQVSPRANFKSAPRQRP